MNWDASIDAAAKWWGDHLRHFCIQDNGVGFHSAMLTLAASEVPDPTEEQILAFEEALRNRLREEVQKRPQAASYGINLGVDYSPDTMLFDALSAAGLAKSARRLPCKSWTVVEHNRVQAACGYRAPIETIYPEAKAP